MSFCTSLSLIYQRKTFQTYIVWRSNLIINTSIITTSKSNLTITIMVYPNRKSWKLRTCHFLQVNYDFDHDNFLRVSNDRGKWLDCNYIKTAILQEAVDFVQRIDIITLLLFVSILLVRGTRQVIDHFMILFSFRLRH